MALPGWAIVSCAASSATVAVVFTHPADVVKTRLQVRRHDERVATGRCRHRAILDVQTLSQIAADPQVLSATQQDTTAFRLARELFKTQGKCDV